MEASLEDDRPPTVVSPNEEEPTRAVPEVVCWKGVLPSVVSPAVLDVCELVPGVVSSTKVSPGEVTGSLLLLEENLVVDCCAIVVPPVKLPPKVNPPGEVPS